MDLFIIVSRSWIRIRQNTYLYTWRGDSSAPRRSIAETSRALVGRLSRCWLLLVNHSVSHLSPVVQLFRAFLKLWTVVVPLMLLCSLFQSSGARIKYEFFLTSNLAFGIIRLSGLALARVALTLSACFVNTAWFTLS